MEIGLISLLTALVAIIAIYVAVQIKDFRVKLPAIIAFSLLLMGETLDLIAATVSSTLLTAFVEILELFITSGFFALLYYIKVMHDEAAKKRKKRRVKA